MNITDLTLRHKILVTIINTPERKKISLKQKHIKKYDYRLVNSFPWNLQSKVTYLKQNYKIPLRL